MQFQLSDKNGKTLDTWKENMQIGEEIEERKIGRIGSVLGYNIEGDCLNLQLLLKNEIDANHPNEADIVIASIVIHLKENKINCVDQIPLVVEKKENGMNCLQLNNGVIRKNDKIICLITYMKDRESTGSYNDSYIYDIGKIYHCKTKEELYSCCMRLRTDLWNYSKSDMLLTNAYVSGRTIAAGGDHGSGVIIFPKKNGN